MACVNLDIGYAIVILASLYQFVADASVEETMAYHKDIASILTTVRNLILGITILETYRTQSSPKLYVISRDRIDDEDDDNYTTSESEEE